MVMMLAKALRAEKKGCRKRLAGVAVVEVRIAADRFVWRGLGNGDTCVEGQAQGLRYVQYGGICWM